MSYSFDDSDKTPVAVFTFVQSDSEYVHPTVEFMYVEDGSPRRFDSRHPLANFEITGQGGSRDKSMGVYAFSYHYNARSIGLAEAQRMVKTLTKVEKHWAKLNDELGYTEDWAEGARRVIAALGVKEVWITRDRRSTYSNSNYQIASSLGDACDRMRSTINRWLRGEELAA